MEPKAGRREWTALAVLMLPLLLVSMDVSVLYFAVPFIARDLEPTATQQLWIFDVYGFVLAGLLLTMGVVGDRIGRRRLLLIGAAGFGAASLLAAYATSAEMLIAARAILGISGATLMPSTLALLRNLFLNDKERATAIAVWTGVLSAGVAVGPVISGILLEHFWWGSVFLINLPAMALLLVLVPLLVPEFGTDRSRRFDAVGSLLSLGAMLPIVYGVKQVAAQEAATSDYLLIAFGVAAAVAFVHRLRTSDHPMIDLRLLSNALFRRGLVTNLIAMFALVGNAVFTTQYLQSVLDLSPLRAALWSLAPTVVVMAAAPAAVTLAQRFGGWLVMAAGFVIAALGFGLLTRVGDDSLVGILVGGGVLAVGLVSVMTVAGEGALRTIAPERAGSASAMLETSSELGGALGMALLGSIGAYAYRTSMATPSGLDTEQAHLAHETLGGALAVAADVPASLGAALTGAAHDAFVGAVHTQAWAGAVLMLAAAAYVVLDRRNTEAVDQAPAEAEVKVPLEVAAQR